MEDDVLERGDPAMTTDRDRVEVALRAAQGNNWAARYTLGDRMQRREAMSRALAAADALAPPPALDRDAVAEAIEPGRGHAGAAYAAADRVLALLPAAPPPVPEGVRRAYSRWEAAIADGCSGATISNAHENFLRTAAAWARTLLATPAPPADTGDADPNGCQMATIEGLLQAREQLRSELKAEIANRVTLTRRVRELEQALRPFAIRMPPGRVDADFYRPLDPFSLVGDHRRAHALVGSEPAGRADQETDNA